MDLLATESARRIIEIDREIIADGSTRTLEEVATSAGTTRSYLTTKGPYRDDQGRVIGVIGNSRDITERKRVEALARDSLLLANVRDSVIVTDLEGIITYWNEGATRLFGWRAEEMMGRHYSARYPEAVRSWIVEEIRSRAEGTSWSGEYEDYRKDGSRVWIEARVNRFNDADGKPAGILGLAYDITDRVRAEEGLRASEERFRFLAESIPHMVWAASPEGHGIYHNARSLEYLDLPPGQVNGQGWAEAIHPDDRESALDAWNFALAHEAEYRVDCRVRNGKTGEYRWFHCHAMPQRRPAAGSFSGSVLARISTSENGPSRSSVSSWRSCPRRPICAIRMG